MSDSKKNICLLLIVAGVFMTFIGVAAYFYGDDTVIFGRVVATSYPYRDIGIAMTVMGIMLGILGFLLLVLTAGSSLPGQQQPQAPMQQPLCQGCGSVVPQDCVLCPHCGLGRT